MRLSQFIGVIREAGGKPTGKAQQAIWNYFEKSPDLNGWVELSEMATNPAFRGIHFGQIQDAAGALKKKGLIEYDGTSRIRKASLVQADDSLLHPGTTGRAKHPVIKDTSPDKVWDTLVKNRNKVYELGALATPTERHTAKIYQQQRPGAGGKGDAVLKWNKAREQRKSNVQAASDLGEKFSKIVSQNPAIKDVKLDPKMRKKILMTIWKKYKQMGDGLMQGGKRKIMDAADGYHSYILEDMTDGELLAFARWKGILR